jgi:hypothetical protein
MATAPRNRDVVLSVVGKDGATYMLLQTWRLTDQGWVHSKKRTPLEPEPVRK